MTEQAVSVAPTSAPFLELPAAELRLIAWQVAAAAPTSDVKLQVIPGRAWWATHDARCVRWIIKDMPTSRHDVVPQEVVVPAAALLRLASAVPDDEAVSIALTADGGHIVVAAGSTTLIEATSTSRFPWCILPDTAFASIVLDRAELLRILDNAPQELHGQPVDRLYVVLNDWGISARILLGYFGCEESPLLFDLQGDCTGIASSAVLVRSDLRDVLAQLPNEQVVLDLCGPEMSAFLRPVDDATLLLTVPVCRWWPRPSQS